MPSLSYAQVAGYAAGAGFRGQEIVKATAIAFGESSGNPDNVNHNTDKFRSTDFGLWQINDHYWGDLLKSGSWANPADNARMAYTVYKAQGWTAWYAYTNGTYLAHMARAKLGATKMVVGTVENETGQDLGGNPVTGIVDGAKALAELPTFFQDHFKQFVMGLAGGILVLFALMQMSGVKLSTVAKVAAVI